jgi:hypothetical protein
MIDKKYIVYDKNGDVISVVNPTLIMERNVSDSALERIKKLHLDRFNIKERMNETCDTGQLQMFANMIKDIEFELQDLWGFDRDHSMHDWYDVPKCTCPKMDNRERKGTGYQIVSLDCPIHGDK